MGLAGINRSRAMRGGYAERILADDPPRVQRPVPAPVEPKPSPPVMVRDRRRGGYVEVEPRSVDGPKRNERAELFAEARELGVPATPRMKNDELARRIAEAQG